jgi:hypothetical protein
MPHLHDSERGVCFQRGGGGSKVGVGGSVGDTVLQETRSERNQENDND